MTVRPDLLIWFVFSFQFYWSSHHRGSRTSSAGTGRRGRAPAWPRGAPSPPWWRPAYWPGSQVWRPSAGSLLTDLAYILGLIWSEIKQLWDVGLKEYINDMWNVVDFITNSLYVATIGLRTVAYFDVIETNKVKDRNWRDSLFDGQVLREKELGVNTVSLPREDWDTWDPTLISEVC